MKNYLNLTISFLVLMASCQEYSPVDVTSPEFAYNHEFVNAFGQPMEGHSWGFVDQPIIDYSAPTRTVDTNSNLWYYTYQLNIPGYPDADGNFHGQQTVDQDGYLTKTVNISQIPGQGTANEDKNWLSNNAGNPVGDVTTEEMEYVMNWFKTTQNPASTPIHWQEFFVQYIGYNARNVIKAGEMDQLGYEAMDGTWEHVNDFNGRTKTLKYVRNSGTEAWSYRASHSDTYQDDLYTIQYLSFTLPNGHHYEGWYVGFDYESIKYEGNGSLEGNSVFRDGYYCDWVVKVTPGTHQGYPVTVRVMCEDLGHSYDWDFNDVVFDVSFLRESDGVYATIVLQAAGGTMPITVGTTDAAFEIHSKLGTGSLSPILHPKAIWLYKVKVTGCDSPDNTANAKNIPIYVQGSQAVYQISTSAIAQKFACPDDVSWSEECVNICATYPNVPAWINNERSMNDARDVWALNPSNDK